MKLTVEFLLLVFIVIFCLGVAVTILATHYLIPFLIIGIAVMIYRERVKSKEKGDTKCSRK